MGDDILTGIVGKDHFNCGAGTDTITNFQPGVDTRQQIVKIVSMCQLLQRIMFLRWI